VQMKDAENLQRTHQGAPCQHPKLDKEYYLGAQTGDYVCTKCGQEFSPAEAAKLRSRS